eukprot:TRINITY_DN15028_c0_g3_i2.p1 TRINITY_DN15028_c0_g3~~TRINITY_DN15028_c0_g3_i2.p1  ORF type:complete len:131 (-),score=22.84 TRINITY_DN15028_c0_g3_i2:474-866(-)
MGLDNHAKRTVRVTLGHPPVVFAMPGAQDLAAPTMAHLRWSLGVCSFKVFKNNEMSNKLEQSVSNCDVYIICQRNDTMAEVNVALMHLFFLIDAVRSESAYRSPSSCLASNMLDKTGAWLLAKRFLRSCG